MRTEAFVPKVSGTGFVQREIIPPQKDYSMGRVKETDGWLKIFEVMVVLEKNIVP
jgi:hypothetical protein